MMDVILAVIAVTTLLFTAVMIWLYLMTGGTPDTLITMWFTYILGECGVMGLIKTAKTLKAKQADIEAQKKELSKMAEHEAGK